MYGTILRELRKSKNMTQEEVAKELGISKQAYSYYENQDRKPGLNRLKSICEVFNVPMDTILSAEKNEISNGNIPIVKQRVTGKVLGSNNIIGYAAPPPLYPSSTEGLLYVKLSEDDSNPHLDGYGLIKQNVIPVDGKLYAIHIDKSLVIRRIKSVEHNKMMLIPLNDSYMPDLIDKTIFQDCLIGELIYSFKEY